MEKNLSEGSQIFSSKIQSIIAEFSRSIRSRNKKNSLPWINADILKLMKERDLALKMAIRTKFYHDKYHFAMLRNKVITGLRKARADFFIAIISEARGNPKVIWTQLKNLMGQHHSAGRSIELDLNGKLTKDPSEVAVALNRYFVDSVATIAKGFSTDHVNVSSVNTMEPAFSINTVSEIKITGIIRSLKPSKAKDSFGMDSTMLKDIGSSLANPITKIVNLSISQGQFPSIWKSAIVTPIFKSGDHHSACNYRPISILPIMSKVAEKCVAEQIIHHLNNSSFPLHPMQFGFRSNHSTETANCFFIEKIKSLLDKRGVVGAVFLDLRKAFDTVNHKVLLSKLSNFNFSVEARQWVESYLFNRTQTVRINNQQSDTLSLSTGVPQGSILGPLLFCLYINDLPSVCPEAHIQMYADDTVLYVHGLTKTEVAAKLTKAMLKITAWLNQCCLQLNVSKTVGMFFSKTNDCSENPDVLVSGEKLEIVKEFKYLGIILDSNFNFRAHVKTVCKRIKFNLANFKFIRNSMSTQAAMMYMHSMIFSHMSYCLTSWSQANHTTLKPLQSLYKQTLKVLDKKPRQFHHCAILRKHNLVSWENMIKHKNACLFYKIIHGMAPPPLREFVTIRTNQHRITRGVMRGDCIIPFRKSTFSQSAFSVAASREWNNIPTCIRDLNTYRSFSSNLKQWLIDNMICQH